jgi:hypothetical protein
MSHLLLKALLVFTLAFASIADIPYDVDKRSLPSGSDFSKILPEKVGAFTRKEFTPPQPGLDGEATYSDGKKEIFMLFSLAETEADRKEVMQTIYTEVKNNRTTEKPLVSLKTDPAYIKYIGPKMAFFAWTRGKYCFSADAVGGSKESLDAFMQAFPY